VILRLASPEAVCLQWRVVSGTFCLILRRPFHEDSSPLLLFLNIPVCVAPQSRFCPEGGGYLSLCHPVLHIIFITEDKGRQPLVFPGVLTPAVEAKVVAEYRRPVVGAIKTHNVETLIFDPDTAYEATFLSFHSRIDVENQAANLTQELTAHIGKLVMSPVEAIHV